MDPFTPPPSAAHVLTPDGEAFIWQPYSTIVIQKARGILSMSLARGYIDFYEVILVPGTCVTVFDEYSELTEYTRDARESLTKFWLDKQSMLDAFHFLLLSKSMALGIGSFKHVMGANRVFTYTDRQSFRSAYEGAVAKADEEVTRCAGRLRGG